MMGNHNQKRHLPQFFTPETVVQFMFDLAGFNPLWKVTDPACGDDAFLKEIGAFHKTVVWYLEKREPAAGHQTILAEVEELDLNGRPNPQLQQVVAGVHEHHPQLARQPSFSG